MTTPAGGVRVVTGDDGTSTPRVAISIVHWNGGASTIACIESAFAQDHPDLRIVVVDNGSSDGVADVVEARWPSITVVRNATNTGFTGGHNIGIAAALRSSPDYVLLLNQDAVMMDGCLARMIALAESDPRIGLVSPMIYYADQPERAQYRGSWLDETALAIVSDRDLDATKRRDADPGTTMCLWGTALLIRRALIDAIGVLDGRLFAYWEDSDYGARAAAAGFRSRMCFDAGLLHEGHVDRTTRRPHFFYFMSRNELVFWRSNVQRNRWARVQRRCTARVLREAAKLRDAGRDDAVAACLSGLWDAFIGHYGAYQPQRRAPRWLGRIVLAHPYFLADLLEGNWKALSPRRARGARA